MYGRALHIIAILFFPVIVISQIRSVNNNMPKGYFCVGVDAGLTSFFGDIDEGIAPGGTLQNNYAFSFHASKNFNSILILEGHITAGKVSGEKKRGSNGSGTYRYFKAGFIEYTFNAGINLIAFISKNINRKINVYANIGIGLIDIKTKLYDGKNDSVVKSFGYGNQKSTTELAIPIGSKIVYHLSHSSAISLQTTFSRVNTDKLDAVEGNNNSDYYNFTSIGYIYKFYVGQRKRIPDRRSAGGFKGIFKK
ncbi:MAG: hypothetical protein B6D61_04135 [Bacteroidetes bacterium 4484_249]|nr:MAG: hypothetical protein B6D61_04135 [Bacteroidetes bacterium 4484_249]